MPREETGPAQQGQQTGSAQPIVLPGLGDIETEVARQLTAQRTASGHSSRPTAPIAAIGDFLMHHMLVPGTVTQRDPLVPGLGPGSTSDTVHTRTSTNTGCTTQREQTVSELGPGTVSDVRMSGQHTPQLETPGGGLGPLFGLTTVGAYNNAVTNAPQSKFSGGIGELAPELKNKIWAHEFIEFGELLNPTAENQMKLVIQQDAQGSSSLGFIQGGETA